MTKQDLTHTLSVDFGLPQKQATAIITTIFEEIQDALVALKAKGVKLGRHTGNGKSRLDGKEEEIRIFIQKGVNPTAIAKICGVSRSNMVHFIKTRKLRDGER